MEFLRIRKICYSRIEFFLKPEENEPDRLRRDYRMYTYSRN